MTIFTKIVFFAALFAVIIILLITLNSIRRITNAQKHTASILKRFALTRGFRVLSGLELNVDGKTCPTENILIGYFGILVVKTLGERGEYFGETNDRSWTLIQGRTEDSPGEKIVIPNPLAQMQRTTVAIRTLLVKNGMAKVPVESVVYIADKSKNTFVYVKHDDNIQLPGKLPRYLNREKFEVDTGLDIQKVEQLLTANASSTN